MCSSDELVDRLRQPQILESDEAEAIGVLRAGLGIVLVRIACALKPFRADSDTHQMAADDLHLVVVGKACWVRLLSCPEYTPRSLAAVWRQLSHFEPAPLPQTSIACTLYFRA